MQRMCPAPLAIAIAERIVRDHKKLLARRERMKGAWKVTVGSRVGEAVEVNPAYPGIERVTLVGRGGRFYRPQSDRDLLYISMKAARREARL